MKRSDVVSFGESRQKPPKVGLRQAYRLCQMSEVQRLAFIAEGLPKILRSAQRAWDAAERIGKTNGREAEVLEGVALEESAKVLILIDSVRCPARLVPSKMNRFIGWFYDHLARLLYAEASLWKPTNIAELRSYIDSERRGHYLDGDVGEFILPNLALYRRERSLYVDVEAYQDGALTWSEPSDPNALLFSNLTPPSLLVASALERVGVFTPAGLTIVSEVWGSLEFKDQEDHEVCKDLIEQMLHCLDAKGLISVAAEEADFIKLYEAWQMPMYNLDFSLIPVPLEQLALEQDRELRSLSS